MIELDPLLRALLIVACAFTIGALLIKMYVPKEK